MEENSKIALFILILTFFALFLNIAKNISRIERKIKDKDEGHK